MLIDPPLLLDGLTTIRGRSILRLPPAQSKLDVVMRQEGRVHASRATRSGPYRLRIQGNSPALRRSATRADGQTCGAWATTTGYCAGHSGKGLVAGPSDA